MGLGGQRHAPAALLPGMTRYPLYRRLCRSEQVLKMSPPTGIRSPDRPARSESLYRLSYPGPLCYPIIKFNLIYVGFDVSAVNTKMPIPVAVRSKAWAYGCTLAGIAGSNLSGVMGICLF
jgi:hypothetical protein